MITWGISANSHNAALAVFSNNSLVFASESERFSRIKNDPYINESMINHALSYGEPELICWYEDPLKKRLRQIVAGQGPFINNFTKYFNCKHKFINHHYSHACAGYFTSKFLRSAILVIDAIGEFDTISIWAAENNSNGHETYKKLWGQKYPHSIGLFYSAMTKHVGLKPMDEEYIMMGMAAYGQKGFADHMKSLIVEDEWNMTFKDNLHVGVAESFMSTINDMDVAASAQYLTENLIYNVMRRAKNFGWSNNLVYMGGVALNCSANRNLGDYFDNIWIMPNPGDAGSSLGAAALAYGKRINWTNAFLGFEIPGPYPCNDILDALVTDRIVGVASGRAEFGPRALGNRSLLADPRGPDIKDRVNEIKRRQKFRPFAPVILEEMAEEYFIMHPGWKKSPYMQSVAVCRYPKEYPAIVHADGTSRVQTVPKDGSGIRELLEKWFVMTGCPMLLNTSLNIRGEPMVNDRADADRFEKLYNVKVCS